jgi:hypothetical protein
MNNQGPTFAEGGYNPLLDRSVATGLDQASQNFQRNIAPSIKRDSIAKGQYGGTRGDLALGTAAGDANSQALNAAMGAYQNQYQGDRAANLQSQVANNQMRLGAGQQMGGLIQGNADNTAQGIGLTQQLAQLGMAPSNMYSQLQQQQRAPLDQQQQTVGGPQVLGYNNATGTSASNPELNMQSLGKGGGGSSNFFDKLPGVGKF